MSERYVITGDVLHHPIQCRHSESSNSRPDLRRQRPVRCHHHAVSGSPIPRTGQELPKL
jgi:hypothetical protein